MKKYVFLLVIIAFGVGCALGQEINIKYLGVDSTRHYKKNYKAAYFPLVNIKGDTVGQYTNPNLYERLYDTYEVYVKSDEKSKIIWLNGDTVEFSTCREFMVSADTNIVFTMGYENSNDNWNREEFIYHLYKYDRNGNLLKDLSDYYSISSYFVIGNFLSENNRFVLPWWDEKEKIYKITMFDENDEIIFEKGFKKDKRNIEKIYFSPKGNYTVVEYWRIDSLKKSSQKIMFFNNKGNVMLNFEIPIYELKNMVSKVVFSKNDEYVFLIRYENVTVYDTKTFKKKWSNNYDFRIVDFYELNSTAYLIERTINKKNYTEYYISVVKYTNGQLLFKEKFFTDYLWQINGTCKFKFLNNETFKILSEDGLVFEFLIY